MLVRRSGFRLPSAAWGRTPTRSAPLRLALQAPVHLPRRRLCSDGKRAPPTAEVPKAEAPKAGSVPLSVAIPCGATAGILGSLAGIGGGLVMIPWLRAMTTMSQHTVNGTANFAGVLACSVSGYALISQGVGNLPVAALLVSFSVMTTKYGSAFAHSLPSHLLSRVMGVVIAGMAPVVVLFGKKKTPAAVTDEAAPPATTEDPAAVNTTGRPVNPLGPLPSWFPDALSSISAVHQAWDCAHIVIPVGALTGFASGAFGIGGGVVMTAALGTACGMTQHEAVATSLCAIVPTGLAATYHNARRGAVNFRVAGMIGGASMIAAGATASYITTAIPDKELRYVLASIMVLSGADMVRRSFVFAKRLPK